jgi:Fic family protein
MLITGQIIKQARNAKKLTLKSVSSDTGIDSGLLSHIESGSRKATREQALALSKALGIPEKKLMVSLLSEIIYDTYGDHPYFLESLEAAEEKAQYKPAKTDSTLSNSLQKLLKACDALHNQWKKLHPLSDTQVRNLNEFFDVSYTFESNRIEGNTLTLHETNLVVNKGLTIGGKSLREHLEAINHQHAIEFMREIASGREAFSERLIKELHALVLRGIDQENAGRYRPLNVRISGSNHNPPEFYALPQEMSAYIRWYNRSKKVLHPLILAADAHQKLVSIHPFTDGNGRTSRLIMNLILLRAGYPVTIIRGANQTRLAYYDALEKSHVESSPEAFREFVAAQTLQSIQEYLNVIEGKGHSPVKQSRRK